MLRHIDVDAYLLAFNYNPVDREARRESVPLAQEKGVDMILGGVLTRGQLTRESEELFASPSSVPPPPRRSRNASRRPVPDRCPRISIKPSKTS